MWVGDPLQNNFSKLMANLVPPTILEMVQRAPLPLDNWTCSNLEKDCKQLVYQHHVWTTRESVKKP